MKQRWYRWVPISAVFVAFSLTSASAAIQLDLEAPAAGSSVSGIALVRGWAFADNGNPVTVTLRLDGLPITDPSVACCSSRQDVQTTVSGAPLDTGFGATVNYGEINIAGPHTVGVEVSADGETTLVIDHAVVVVRPGNVSQVSTFDLSGATCSDPQADSILINNVSVSGSGGSPTVTNVRAQYQTEAQGLVITEASGGPALTSFKSNLNGSQEVPTPTNLNCTGTGTLTLNADNTITCSVTFSGLTGPAAAAHIHQAPPGVAGGIIIGLTVPAGGASPATCPTPAPTLTADQLTALRQGNLYFNVHTSGNPSGECRGQIVAGQ